MLRLDHLQKQRQGKGGSDHHSVGAARSLEVLLGQPSALAIAGRNHHEQGQHYQQDRHGEAAAAVAAAAAAGGGTGVARSSVSSSWSPPHLNTPLSARRGSSISSGIGTSIGIRIGSGGDGGGGSGGIGGGGGTPAGGGRGDGGKRVGVAAASPWRSDPPTPRMPCLGGNGPWTPSGKESGAADAKRHVPPRRALSAARMSIFVLFCFSVFSSCCFVVICFVLVCPRFLFCVVRACLALRLFERFLRVTGMCFSEAEKG